MKTNNEIIFISNRVIKSMNDDTGEIGSHSIVFGDKSNKDFHGNWFTQKTFLGHNREDGAVDVGLLNHRVPLFRKNQFDPATEKALKEIADMRFKNPVISKVDGIGEFSSLVLDLSDKYEKMVYELAKKGVFKWSSGTAPQTYKALPTGELEMFVVVEKSLTPIPAEYRMLEHRVMPLKAYTDFMEREVIEENINEHIGLTNFFKGYSAIKNFEIAMEETAKGGKGSGFFGHAGRDAENLRGGSAPRGGGKMVANLPVKGKPKEWKDGYNSVTEFEDEFNPKLEAAGFDKSAGRENSGMYAFTKINNNKKVTIIPKFAYGVATINVSVRPANQDWYEPMKGKNFSSIDDAVSYANKKIGIKE